VDRKGEIPEGKKPYFRLPIFNYHKVRFSFADPIAIVLMRLLQHCC